MNAAKSAKRLQVKQFVEFYLGNARQYVKTVVGYVPLPDEIYDLAGTRFINNKVGTVLAGKSQIGLNMETLFNREAGL